MAETAKILCPDKTVLLPDIDAGCSLANDCPADEFQKFKQEKPPVSVLVFTVKLRKTLEIARHI